MKKTSYIFILLAVCMGFFDIELVAQDLCPPRFLETSFSSEIVDLYWDEPDTANYGDILLFECFESCSLASEAFNIVHLDSVGGSGGWFRYSDGDSATCGSGMIPCSDGLEDGFSAVALWCSTGTTIDSRMYTDLIDLTSYSTAHLEFVETYNYPEDSHDSNMVEISTNGGETWDIVYVSDPLVVLGDYWYNTVDLSEYAGQQIHIAFRYLDVTGNGEGWFVDDVRVWGGNGGETTTCGAFNEYEVYVNGSVVDVTTDTYYSVEGLTNGTEYCFEVRALYSEGSSEPCAQQCAAPMGAFVVDPLAINFENPLMEGEYQEQTFSIMNFDTANLDYSVFSMSLANLQVAQDLLADDFNDGLIYFDDTSFPSLWLVGDSLASSSTYMTYETPPDGGMFAYVNDDLIGDGIGVTNATMISNEIELMGTETVFLLLDLLFPQPDGHCYEQGLYSENASISYSTDAGTTWDVLDSNFTTGWYWASYMYNLTPLISGANSLKIKFNYDDCEGNWGYGIGVDNVAIKQGDMLSWLTISPYDGKVLTSGSLNDTVAVTVGVYGQFDGFTTSENLYLYGGSYTVNFPVGVGVTVSLDDNHGLSPFKFKLNNNYPNPFNPETTIGFSVAKNSEVTILIYNILGQKVATLLDGQMSPGKYTMKWRGLSDTGKELPSGMYFYEMTTSGFHEIKKLVLVR